MNFRFKQVYKNEWYEIPWSDEFVVCCDCGLGHVYDYKVTEDGKLLRKGRRDAALTRAARRRFPKAVKHKTLKRRTV